MEEPDRPLGGFHLNAKELIIEAFHEFRQLLTAQTDLARPSSTKYRPWLTILARGDLACGLHLEGEDVECVALGNIRKELFMQIAWERIKDAQIHDATIRPFVVSAERIVLELRGISFDMQYLQCKELINAYPEVLNVPTKFQLQLADEVNDVVNGLRDHERFRAGHSKIPLFPELHGFIVSWAKAVGLSGPGNLDHTALRELSWKIAAQTGDTSTQPTCLPEMLRPFLHDHSQCFDPIRMKPSERCSLGPQLNITENCSKTLHEEFARLSSGLICRDTNVLLKDFLSMPVADWLEQEEVIRVSVCYSGNSKIDGYRIMAFMDEMFLNLIQLLESTSGDSSPIDFRAWPTRLSETSSSIVDGQDEPYEGCWMIGIRGSQDERRTRSITRMLATWEQRIQIVLKHPASSITVFTALCKRLDSRLESLKVDKKYWQRPIAEPDPSLRLDVGPEQQIGRHSKKYAPNQPPHAAIGVNPSGKLRPAMEVLNRLRWDHRFNVDDYVVVYRDRHDGMLERSVGEWETDTTASEWIPQDRIWFFKRLSDGVMVWDREGREDLVNQ